LKVRSKSRLHSNTSRDGITSKEIAHSDEAERRNFQRLVSGPVQ